MRTQIILNQENQLKWQPNQIITFIINQLQFQEPIKLNKLEIEVPVPQKKIITDIVEEQDGQRKVKIRTRTSLNRTFGLPTGIIRKYVISRKIRIY